MDIQDILLAIDELAPHDLQRVSQRIAERQSTPNSQSQPVILNLHAGAMKTSDDFDDPLPDDFWLGET